ncbi:MAG: hypothetical protein C4K47_06445 [Candidatus Thorarchaeota archaeon]|nr:MAG: hypothetical protein C4K47_06445 [Candidatus Thorarchaeota archaeon]
MPEQKARIVNLLSVPLTKDKQSVLLFEFNLYASLTNYIIKLMIRKQINSPSKAESLKESFEKKLFILAISSDSPEIASSENAQSVFESRFNPRTFEHYRGTLAPEQDNQHTGRVHRFVSSYFRDVVRTALSEIAHHRKLAATVRSLGGKTPFFRFGRMIFSAPIASITETSCIIVTTNGDEIPVPFDKRSKSREVTILNALAAGHQKCDRVRLKWHKEGYLDIGVRIQNPVLR